MFRSYVSVYFCKPVCSRQFQPLYLLLFIFVQLGFCQINKQTNKQNGASLLVHVPFRYFTGRLCSAQCPEVEMSTLGLCPHVDISSSGHIYFSISHSPSCIICIMSWVCYLSNQYPTVTFQLFNINLSNFTFASTHHNLINDKMKQTALFFVRNVMY